MIITKTISTYIKRFFKNKKSKSIDEVELFTEKNNFDIDIKKYREDVDKGRNYTEK